MYGWFDSTTFPGQTQTVTEDGFRGWKILDLDSRDIVLSV